jgi:hypothetical protein
MVPKPASGHREFLSGRAAAAPVHPWRRRRRVALTEPLGRSGGAPILAETLRQRGNSVVTNDHWPGACLTI